MLNAGGHKTAIALPRERLLVVGGETHNRGTSSAVILISRMVCFL